MKLKIFILCACILFLAFFLTSMDKNGKIEVGDQVPDFSLLDQNGLEFSSKNHIGKTAMVIFFYPKDDTPGCIKEACGFRDSFDEFEKLKIKVIGISGDDVESHQKFVQKYQLPFTLLADTKGEVRKLFGVKKKIFGLIPGRITYIIDKNGKVIHIYDNMTDSESHIKEALKMFRV